VGIVSRANLLQGFALSEPSGPMVQDDRDPMHQVNVTVSDGAVRLWG
jgi:hypothetical protein